MFVFLTMESCAEWVKSAAESGDAGINATIGNFDGVHVGHQALVRQTTQQAREAGRGALVITFEPHPLRVLGRGDEVPPALNAPAQRLELLAELGVDAVLMLPFTPELATQTAQEFVQSVLVQLEVRQLFVGHDFRMGRDQTGAEKLAEYGAALEKVVDVKQLAAVLYLGAPVSSTRIRQALADGDLALANAMLGRPHAVRGMVVHGEGRGGPLLGFPTANMVVDEVMMPNPAAYATTARLVSAEPDFGQHAVWHWNGLAWNQWDAEASGQPSGKASGPLCPAATAAQRHASITSFGRNPTFAGKRLTLETFILDFSADIYDQTLEVGFLQTLREEKKFSGPQELVAQLNADVETRRQMG